MDFIGSARDSGDSDIRRHQWRSGAEVVELAAAAALRLASDYLLASGRDSGAMPDPVRRAWAPRVLSLQFPTSHGRALEAQNPRGAREIPARLARRLRLWPILRERSTVNRPN